MSLDLTIHHDGWTETFTITHIDQSATGWNAYATGDSQ